MARATEEVIAQYGRYVMETYARSPLVITKAKGSRVWDVEGREYLDLFPGWGVSLLGYNHPFVVRALRAQAGRVLHVSNNYYQPLQWRAARAIAEAAFDGRVFFCNSGAEAVEGAVKLARRWGGERQEIIVTQRSFHGRTMGALSATGQPKLHQGFAPMLSGFVHVPFNDLEAAARAVTPATCAVMIEPIQGEGGVHEASVEYLRGLRRLCDERRLLLVADEVTTGMGRTGDWFAYRAAGIEPDVLLLAKGLAGGVPAGAVLAARRIAEVLPSGSHGTTFGGSPMVCACILAVFEAVEKQGLLARVRTLSRYLFDRLARLRAHSPLVHDVRGRGFMAGIELSVDGRPIAAAARERGLLINCTQERVLRLMPAMTITKAQLARGMAVLEDVLASAAEA
ncbi:MAG TPA: aspartate aminotransferase family protein [bacterium]